MSHSHLHPNSKPVPPARQLGNRVEREAQADRVIMRATRQQERRAVATAGSERRRMGESPARTRHG